MASEKGFKGFRKQPAIGDQTETKPVCQSVIKSPKKTGPCQWFASGEAEFRQTQVDRLGKKGFKAVPGQVKGRGEPVPAAVATGKGAEVGDLEQKGVHRTGLPEQVDEKDTVLGQVRSQLSGG